jgi:nucleoside-diphosphate-sugar epimerase
MAPRHRVLVTGGSGTIGRAVVSELIARGHSVRSLDLVQTVLPGSSKLDVLEGSTADPECVTAAMEGCDAVVHLAAVSDEADFLTMLLDANVKAVYNVLHSARQIGARAILASSTRAVSGMLHGEHHREGSTLAVGDGVAPKDHYGLTKVWAESMAEMYAREYRMSVVSVRIGWCVRDVSLSARARACVYLSLPPLPLPFNSLCCSPSLWPCVCVCVHAPPRG